MASQSTPTLCPINSRLGCPVRCRCHSDSQLLDEDCSMSPVSIEELLGSRRSVTLHHFTEWLYGSGDFRIPIPLVETFHLPIPGQGDADCQHQDSSHDQEERFESLLRRHSQLSDNHNSQQRSSDRRDNMEMNRRPGLRRCASWGAQLTEWTIHVQPLAHVDSASSRLLKIPSDDLSDQSSVIAQATREVDPYLVSGSYISSRDRAEANENLPAPCINLPYFAQPSLNVSTVCESRSHGRSRRFESLLKVGRHFRKGLQRLCCQCICVCIYIQK